MPGAIAAEAPAEGVPLAAPDAVPDAVPLAVAVGAAVPANGPATTGRKVSSAVVPMSSISPAFLPGIVTVMRSVPSMATSLLETPRPLTRSSMIWRASFMASLVGVEPLVVLAFSTTWAPPTRSRPSFGVAPLPGKNVRP